MSDEKPRENQTPKNRLEEVIRLLAAAAIECDMMGCFDGTRDDIEKILHQCLMTHANIENFDDWCAINK